MARREDFRRIGLLPPSSNSVQEGDFWHVLPQGFSLHVARMGLSTVEADSTLRIVHEIDELLDPQDGLFRQGKIDMEGLKTVLALRSRYGRPTKMLDDPTKYFDPSYHAAATTR
jgi:hypothetical protein